MREDRSLAEVPRRRSVRRRSACRSACRTPPAVRMPAVRAPPAGCDRRSSATGGAGPVRAPRRALGLAPVELGAGDGTSQERGEGRQVSPEPTGQPGPQLLLCRRAEHRGQRSAGAQLEPPLARPRVQVGNSDLGTRAAGDTAVDHVQLGDELELHRNDDQGLGHQLDRGGQQGRRRCDLRSGNRPARRANGRRHPRGAADQGQRQLVAGEPVVVLPQRRQVTDGQMRGQIGHRIDQKTARQRRPGARGPDTCGQRAAQPQQQPAAVPGTEVLRRKLSDELPHLAPGQLGRAGTVPRDMGLAPMPGAARRHGVPLRSGWRSTPPVIQQPVYGGSS